MLCSFVAFATAARAPELSIVYFSFAPSNSNYYCLYSDFLVSLGLRY